MKIALDAKKAFTNTAGLGQYSRTLINGLHKYFPENTYQLFTSKINAELGNEINGNFKIILPKSFFSKLIPALWRANGCLKEIKNREAKIYHGLSNELPFGIQKIPNLKKIVTVHDVIFKKHKEQYNTIDRIIYDYKTKYAVENADLIIATSEETKTDIVTFYNVDPNKIKVIYQSCNPIFYKEVNETSRHKILEKYNLKKSFILNVSSFNTRKNHLKMVEAFDQIKNEIDCDLIFIGNQGNEKDKIIEKIKSLDLESRIKILSNVKNEELPSIYQQAKLFLYPSLFEGFGIPIIEALYSKIPVITTKGGCFEEVGGKACLYVNPSSSQDIAEKIKESIANNFSFEKSLDQAKLFNEESFIKETMKVYYSI